MYRRVFPLFTAFTMAGCMGAAQAQTPDTPTPPVPAPGQVVIQSHGEPPATSGVTVPPGGAPPADAQVSDDANADVTDAERSALQITAYDLDARLSPDRSGLDMRAQITVRNDGATPLKQLALQISSTLHWDSATLVGDTGRVRLALAQHRLDTDTDYTGAESEAILPLPAPLAPGSSAKLDLFYSGTVAQSTARLARLGASAAQQGGTDWDAISPGWTGLRGYGNVLWYPVASPQLFFAEGDALFGAIGRTRLREQDAPIHLRLSVEYSGEPPVAAYFCGRRQPLTAVPDDPNTPTATGRGLASADFSPERLGFRTPNLFLLQQPETFLGGGASVAESSSSSLHTALPSPGDTARAPGAASGGDRASNSPVIALATEDTGASAGLAVAADRVTPLLREWLGPHPLSALTVFDHGGQPFGDGPLLVAPVAVLETSPAETALLQSLTHAWVQTGQPWMDEGLAQFFALLWTEREQGRDAALGQLNELTRPVAAAEGDVGVVQGSGGSSGQPLVSASDDMFYRRKAAAVWWMLRGIVGDGNLHAALSAWRTQPPSGEPAGTQAVAFEHLLERLSHQDLQWCCKEWVLTDRGLPDLAIVDVAVALEPASAGRSEGWLVAVSVRNSGGATAEVPLVLHAGGHEKTQRVRVAGGATVTERVTVDAPPSEVTVNDGGTPELHSSRHSRQITLQTR